MLKRVDFGKRRLQKTNGIMEPHEKEALKEKEISSSSPPPPPTPLSLLPPSSSPYPMVKLSEAYKLIETKIKEDFSSLTEQRMTAYNLEASTHTNTHTEADEIDRTPYFFERVSSTDAIGRILAVDITVERPYPASDTSTMDGYALMLPKELFVKEPSFSGCSHTHAEGGNTAKSGEPHAHTAAADEVAGHPSSSVNTHCEGIFSHLQLLFKVEKLSSLPGFAPIKARRPVLTVDKVHGGRFDAGNETEGEKVAVAIACDEINQTYTPEAEILVSTPPHPPNQTHTQHTTSSPPSIPPHPLKQTPTPQIPSPPMHESAVCGLEIEPCALVIRCFRITTGGSLPEGCHCVMPIEYCAPLRGHEASYFKLIRNPPPFTFGMNIRRKGSDLTVGSRVLRKFEVLTHTHLGLLANLRVTSVLVLRKLRVAVLSTGNELIGFEDSALQAEEASTHKIIDSNGPMLSSMLTQSGFDVCARSIAIDSREALFSYFEEARRDDSGVDAVISTGGVSVGIHDYMKEALEFHGKILFGRLSLKPGMPTTFARISRSVCAASERLAHTLPLYVFGLPGNPASAWTTYTLVAEPSLRFLHYWRSSDAVRDSHTRSNSRKGQDSHMHQDSNVKYQDLHTYQDSPTPQDSHAKHQDSHTQEYSHKQGDSHTQQDSPTKHHPHTDHTHTHTHDAHTHHHPPSLNINSKSGKPLFLRSLSYFLPPIVPVRLDGSIKADKIRPEYHRCLIYQPLSFSDKKGMSYFSVASSGGTRLIDTHTGSLGAESLGYAHADALESIQSMESPPPANIALTHTHPLSLLPHHSATVKGDLHAISTGNQISSRLLSCVCANGLLLVPAEANSGISKHKEGSLMSAALVGEVLSFHTIASILEDHVEGSLFNEERRESLGKHEEEDGRGVGAGGLGGGGIEGREGEDGGRAGGRGEDGEKLREDRENAEEEDGKRTTEQAYEEAKRLPSSHSKQTTPPPLPTQANHREPPPRNSQQLTTSTLSSTQLLSHPHDEPLSPQNRSTPLPTTPEDASSSSSSSTHQRKPHFSSNSRLYRVAILTASDSCSQGLNTDFSGPKIRSIFTEEIEKFEVSFVMIVPDDVEQIRQKIRFFHSEMIDLIVITGGTGMGPRDCTPEALRPLLSRRYEGLEQLMLLEGLRKTPYAAFSRLTVGSMGPKTLIFSLPGSTKAVDECIRAVKPLLLHALLTLSSE